MSALKHAGLISRLPQSSIAEERAVYLTQLYYSEIGVTNRVRQLVQQSEPAVLRIFTNC